MIPPSQLQHYLPQMYLSGFADSEGCLWVFDRRTSEYRYLAPKRIAAHKNLYTFEDADGRVRQDIETKLFQLIDAPVRPILSAIEAGLRPKDDDLDALALFIGYLRLRTPGGLHEIEDGYIQSLKLTNPFLSEHSVAKMIQGYESESGERFEMSAQEIVERFSSGELELRPAAGHIVSIMAETGLTVAQYVLSLRWVFLLAPIGRSFILSDEPFVIEPPIGHNPEASGVGVLTPGVKKYVPLTQRVCLLMEEPDTAKKFELVQGHDVRRVNCLIALNSNRFVYGSDERLLRRIVGRTVKERVDRKPEVVVEFIANPAAPEEGLIKVFTKPRVSSQK